MKSFPVTESVIPLANEINPVFFLNSALYFVWTCVAQGVPDSLKLAERMLRDDGLLKYLRRLGNTNLSASWFSRTETSLLYRALRLYEAVSAKELSSGFEPLAESLTVLYRQCALNVLPLISPDRAIAARSIMNFINNPRFILNGFVPIYIRCSSSGVRGMSRFRLLKSRGAFQPYGGRNRRKIRCERWHESCS